MHARTKGWVTGGTGMTIRGVEASSSQTYMQEVRGAIRGCPTDMPLAKAIERLFGELALRKRGISGARTWRRESASWNTWNSYWATITDLHRLQLQAIGKMLRRHKLPTL